MSGRYVRLFSLSGSLYTEGSPVIIKAGALLKDAKTGGVLAQLKLQSITEEIIKAVTVRISTFDTMNVSLGEEVEFQYLDLLVERDEEFGEQTPIYLPLAETRAFSVEVVKVIFADNTAWLGEGKSWEPLPQTASLAVSLDDEEMVKQFQMTYGGSCLYQEEKDLWQCVCEGWNHKEEDRCHACQRSAAALAGFDLDALKNAAEKRIAAEQEAERKEKEAKLEAERRETERREYHAKRIKKKAKIFISTTISIILVVFVVFIVVNEIVIPMWRNEQVTKLRLFPGKMELLPTVTHGLEAKVLPSTLSDISLTWTTSDQSVVSVAGETVTDGNTASAVLTAVAPGKSVVTVHSKNGKSAICIVTVKEPEVVEPNGEVTRLSISSIRAELLPTETYNLKVVANPKTLSNVPLTWESSDESVVTVEGETVTDGYIASAVLTAVAPGESTITVTSQNGKKARCTVIVEEP